MNFKRVLNGIKNGACSSLFSSCVTQPFQVVMTNMMVSYKEGKPISMLHTINKISRAEGIKGFYRGVLPAMIKTTVGSAIYFSILENLKAHLKQNKTYNPILINFFSAAISRTIQMIFVSPLTVIKTRFEVVGFNEYSNIQDGIRKIKRKEGFSGYFKGLSTTLAKEVPYSAMFYSTYEFTKKKLFSVGIQNTQMNSTIASIITVAILTLITNPLEVIRARLQYSYYSNDPNHNYKGVISGIYTISKTEGIKGLSAGILPVFLKKGISTILVWTIYDTLNKYTDIKNKINNNKSKI